MVWNPSDGFFNTLFSRIRACIPEPATKNSTHRNSVAGIDRLTQGKDSAAYACQAAGQNGVRAGRQAGVRAYTAGATGISRSSHSCFVQCIQTFVFRRLEIGLSTEFTALSAWIVRKRDFQVASRRLADDCEASAYRTILSESLGKRSCAQSLLLVICTLACVSKRLAVREKKKVGLFVSKIIFRLIFGRIIRDDLRRLVARGRGIMWPTHTKLEA